MAQAKVVETINAPIDLVWQHLGNFEPKGVEEAKAIRLAAGIYTNAIKNARTVLKAT